MYLAKLFDDAHFAVNEADGETVCGDQIHDDFLLKEMSPRNAVYYIEKFEGGDEMHICPECRAYVRENHGLSEEECTELAQLARAH